MRFKAVVSVAESWAQVARELCEGAAGLTPDLAALWVSPHFGPDYSPLVSAIRDALNPRNLIGCTTEGVIGSGREIEGSPGVALWVAELPDVRVLPFILDQQDLPTLKSAEDWQDRLGVQPDAKPTFLVFPEPFTIQFGVALDAMDEAFPGSPIIGGVASAAKEAGQNRLFLNDQVLRQGMVGVSIAGHVGISTVVSQGCRPVGSPFVITKAESNLIYGLGGRDAYAVLNEVHEAAGPAEKTLMRNGLHVGRVIDEHRERFGPGDFLIRNVVGVVDNRALAITDHFRIGQTVQFHVRDATTADEELRSMLRTKLVELGSPPPGGLVFNCNGRGTRMFTEADHDIRLVNEIMPGCQIAGFFAAGEIGPVGGKSFIHGFTGCYLFFHEPQAD